MMPQTLLPIASSVPFIKLASKRGAPLRQSLERKVAARLLTMSGP
jgi:hypothetical protein